MADCVYCGAESDLYDHGVPICLKYVNDGWRGRQRVGEKPVEPHAPPGKKGRSGSGPRK
jgi:hypothetical protein